MKETVSVVSKVVLALALLFAIPQGAQALVFDKFEVITIPGGDLFTNVGPADPLPSTIDVSMPGLITHVTVTLFTLVHGFPDDIDIMLVGPGPTPVSLILMSDAGGGINGVDNFGLLDPVDLVFDDGGIPLPDEAQIIAGIFAPTNYGPGDTFTASPSNICSTAPSSLALSAFNGISPNGTWSLCIEDDQFTHTLVDPDDISDLGQGFAVGWSLDITTRQEPPQVPESSTLILLASGLLVLVAYARKVGGLT